MKKIYTLLVVLLFSTAMFGQTFLSEDFSGGQMPPPGWLSLPFGDNWSTSTTSNAGGSSPECVFTGSPMSNARLISPVVDLTGMDTVILLFKHAYSGQGASIGVALWESYAWVPIWEITPVGSAGPEDVQIMITNPSVGTSSFKFSFYLTGNIAGVNNWYIDDIVLFYPPNLDASMSNINVPSIITGPEPVAGTIKNLGNTTITDVSVSWESYSGIVYDSAFTGLSLELLESFDFDFDGLWVQPFGTHNLKMWINSVNGGMDDDQNNDTLTKSIAYLGHIIQARPCFEEFTSSTCAPCYSFNLGFVPWTVTNADDITLIKYQMNWPGAGDPYYTPEGGTRRGYYGVTYVPDLYCNGAQVNTSMGSVQSAFDAAMDKASTIEIASSFSITGTNINLTTTVLPFSNMGTKKVFSVLFEKVTTGNVASNGETEFHHVMMKMFPDASGATVTLNDKIPVSLSYTFDLSTTHVEELDDLMVGVMIQDQATKEIIQSGYGYQDAGYSSDARLSSITLDGEPLEGFSPDTVEHDVGSPLGTVVEPVIQVVPMDDGAITIITQAFQLPGTATIDVYSENLAVSNRYQINYTIFTAVGEKPVPSVQIFPNPAKDHIYIIGLQKAKVAMYSVEGKLMLSQENFSGNVIDLSSLPRGIYILNIMTDNAIIIRKKIVVL